jgi:lipoprotein-releasing system ATP-binding protein
LGFLVRLSGDEIGLKGRDVSKASSKEKSLLRNRELGFIFQYHHLLPEFTALMNVMIPRLIDGVDRNVAREKGIALLKEVGS